MYFKMFEKCYTFQGCSAFYKCDEKFDKLETFAMKNQQKFQEAFILKRKVAYKVRVAWRV